jgi:hypothetical protein
MATSYWYLFLIRMGVGAAESASSPGTQSLIASLFPVRHATHCELSFIGTSNDLRILPHRPRQLARMA